MTQIEIAIPQMGEGLQEVRIVEFQKKPGDTVKRDELLYTMETDKALMEVESPYEGVLEEWLAAEDDVVPIGAPIARLQTQDAATDPEIVPREAGVSFAATAGAPAPQPPASTARPDAHIPPRTRAYCRELGLSEEEMRRIPAPSGKLMPADVDAYQTCRTTSASDTAPQEFTERPLSPQQRTFAYRVKRSAQIVVPATMKRPMPWDDLKAHVERLRSREPSQRPTEFQTFAYCVALAAREHPKFRSVFAGEEAIREYAHLNLGIAVARDNGDLVTAVVPKADTQDYHAFIQTAQTQIAVAREGRDQADAATQLLLTSLGPYGITDGVPVLVSPAMAVLLLGAPYTQEGQTVVNLILTFDHRFINGVEGAQFLQSVVTQVEQVSQAIMEK